MKLYDTLSTKLKELDDSKIRIYLCGMTVYDESHIGHARTIIVFDVLRRYLESKGKQVVFIQNFTDVDDKIINRAKKENIPADELGKKYINRYFEDFDSLNVKKATEYPKATEHIGDMIAFIQELLDKKIAYVSKNGVYFSVSKFPEYGKLSKKNIDDLKAGARVKIDETKEDHLDFALWKFSDEQPNWDSPWGKGRPGWHIECSAMSTKYLGQNFEIHGGGRDLIFPHHENEIAQSEAHSGSPFAKIWMHVGMVTINGEKMSKSLGNIKTVGHVLDNWGPNIIRIFCLSGHYSKPIDYSEEMLKESYTKWRLVETCYFELANAPSFDSKEDIDKTIQDCKTDFDESIEDDFNTHLALSSFFKLVKEVNKISAKDSLNKEFADKTLPVINYMMDVLGLAVQTPTDEQRKEIEELIKTRNLLREQKKFSEADQIREKLNQMSVELVDHKQRTNWILRERIKAESSLA